MPFKFLGALLNHYWFSSQSIAQCYICFLLRQDRAKAVEILVKDLKVFASFNEELFKEITHLLTLENFRYLTLTSFLI